MAFAHDVAARVTRLIVRVPLLRRVAAIAYMRLRPKGRTSERGPFDRSLGIDTAGFLPPALLSLGKQGAHASPYLACVPGSLRRVLSHVPSPQRWAFIDLGCGKGRGLAVASELPFRTVTGLELSPDLVRIARANARQIARRQPGRTPIDILLADASAPQIGGPTVLMLFHSFDATLVSRLLDVVEAAAGSRHPVLFVYVNPVHGHLADARSCLRRWFAEYVLHDEAERAYALGDGEAVVIWQAGGLAGPGLPGCDRPITVRIEGWQAVLGPRAASP